MSGINNFNSMSMAKLIKRNIFSKAQKKNHTLCDILRHLGSKSCPLSNNPRGFFLTLLNALLFSWNDLRTFLPSFPLNVDHSYNCTMYLDLGWKRASATQSWWSKYFTRAFRRLFPSTEIRYMLFCLGFGAGRYLWRESANYKNGL